MPLTELHTKYVLMLMSRLEESGTTASVASNSSCNLQISKFTFACPVRNIAIVCFSLNNLALRDPFREAANMGIFFSVVWFSSM